jgi:hypothetical protein
MSIFSKSVLSAGLLLGIEQAAVDFLSKETSQGAM